METRPAEFWGTGNALGRANGEGGTAPQSGGGHNSTIEGMPACYSGWTKFEAFLPRDNYFAYPLLGNLYKQPVGVGAQELYGRESNLNPANVLAIIPWAISTGP